MISTTDFYEMLCFYDFGTLFHRKKAADKLPTYLADDPTYLAEYPKKSFIVVTL